MRAVEPTSGPVEAKVKTAGAGAAVAGLVVWLLSRYVYPGDVPEAVRAVVDVVVPGVVAFAAGWVTRHTPRGDADALDPPTAP